MEDSGNFTWGENLNSNPMPEDSVTCELSMSQPLNQWQLCRVFYLFLREHFKSSDRAHTLAPSLKLDPINSAKFSTNILGRDRVSITLTLKSTTKFLLLIFDTTAKGRRKITQVHDKNQMPFLLTQNFFIWGMLVLFLFHDSSIAIYNKFYNRENFS